MHTQNPAPPRPDISAPVARGRGNDLGHTSYVLGIVAMAAVFIPPGLFVAPLCGIAAVVLGSIAYRQAVRVGAPTDRAITGITLGLIAIVTAGVILWAFHHAIGNALHEINAGNGGH
jgi:hypothetical protein